jgi:DNA segregation ATPase FtsK/SpoIIIE-like protein
MRNAFIEKAIFDLARFSSVFLFCYVEGDKAGSREEFFWPEGWPKDVGPKGIVLSEYSASTFHYVEKQPSVSLSTAHNASEYLETGAREKDPLYPLAKALLKQSGHSSISLVIRHLNIG